MRCYIRLTLISYVQEFFTRLFITLHSDHNKPTAFLGLFRAPNLKEGKSPGNEVDNKRKSDKEIHQSEIETKLSNGSNGCNRCQAREKTSKAREVM